MGLLDKFKKVKKEEKRGVDEKSAKVDNGLKSKKETKEESMKKLYEDNKIKKTQESIEGKDGKKIEKRKHSNAYKVLIRPLITEKASVLGAEKKYFFEVERHANKIEIAKAIKDVYGVKPISVNIINMGGKNVRLGRIRGRRKSWKKAVITLPEGESIKVYEGV
jgi:large subunit ribosomal protein L23